MNFATLLRASIFRTPLGAASNLFFFYERLPGSSASPKFLYSDFKKIRVFSSQTKKCWPKIMRRLMISLRNFYKQVFLYLVITVLFEKDPLAFINICTCDLKISAASYNRS